MSNSSQGPLTVQLIGIAIFMGFLWIFQGDNEIEWGRADRTYSVGKVYKWLPRKDGDEVRFFYYFNGKKRLITRYSDDAGSSTVGKFFAIRYPQNKPEDCELNINYEIIDTSSILKAGFKSITKHRFDIPTGKYVAYKVFQ